MITNPAPVVGADDDDDQPVSTGKRNVYVKKFKYPDPDTTFDKMLGVLDTRIVNVDAKLVTGMREGRCDITHFRSLGRWRPRRSSRTASGRRTGSPP